MLGPWAKLPTPVGAVVDIDGCKSRKLSKAAVAAIFNNLACSEAIFIDFACSLATIAKPKCTAVAATMVNTV